MGLGKHICATIRVQMSKVGTICCSCLPDSFFPFIWGHHILLWGVLWMKQCPPKIHMVKPCPPVYQHLTVIRDRAFKEVCLCVCVCVGAHARMHTHVCVLVAQSCSMQSPWDLSMRFSSQDYCSVLPSPSPGEFSQSRDRTRVSLVADRFFTI